MKISELKAKQGKVELVAEITEISPPREFQRFGKMGKVANSLVKDDSGEIVLTLWNEDVDNYKVGDKIKVSNGYVSEWQGALQLSAGRYGTIERYTEEASEGSDEKSEPPAETPEEKPAE